MQLLCSWSLRTSAGRCGSTPSRPRRAACRSASARSTSPRRVRRSTPPDAWALLQTARAPARPARAARRRPRPRGVDPPGRARCPGRSRTRPDPSAWIEPHPVRGAPPLRGASPRRCDRRSRPALASYGDPGRAADSRSRTPGRRPTRFAELRDQGPSSGGGRSSTPGATRTTGSTGVVKTDVKLRRPRIGYTDSDDRSRDPRGHRPARSTASVDRIAGHGTFIAGLVHQACPDAQILSWRGIPADAAPGRVRVADDAGADRRAGRVWHRRRGARAVTRSTCSACRWATTTRTPPTTCSTRSCGRSSTSSAASASSWSARRATTRRTGRATRPRSRRGANGKGPVRHRRNRVPVVSVGALNPNTHRRPVHQRAGRGCARYAPGASVMSTMPPFQGGLQPMAQTWIDGRIRESIDPDDFRRC